MLLRLSAGEVALEPLPAFVVFVLQYLFLQRVARRPHDQPRLEHKGKRVRYLSRRKLGTGSALKGLGIRAMAGHAVVQARTAGQEALSLGVVFAVNEAHELIHSVAMKPWRTEGVFGNQPAWRKDGEIHIRRVMQR